MKDHAFNKTKNIKQAYILISDVNKQVLIYNMKTMRTNFQQ